MLRTTSKDLRLCALPTAVVVVGRGIEKGGELARLTAKFVVGAAAASGVIARPTGEGNEVIEPCAPPPLAGCSRPCRRCCRQGETSLRSRSAPLPRHRATAQKGLGDGEGVEGWCELPSSDDACTLSPGCAADRRAGCAVRLAVQRECIVVVAVSSPWLLVCPLFALPFLSMRVHCVRLVVLLLSTPSPAMVPTVTPDALLRSRDGRETGWSNMTSSSGPRTSDCAAVTAAGVSVHAFVVLVSLLRRTAVDVASASENSCSCSCCSCCCCFGCCCCCCCCPATRDVSAGPPATAPRGPAGASLVDGRRAKING